MYPWSILLSTIAGMYVLIQLILRFRRRQKKIRSVQWPMIGGSFKTGSISPFRCGAGESINFRLSVEFSYRVGERMYPGTFVQEFPTEGDAASLLKSLEQGPLYIRYDPASPTEYVLDPYRDVWQPSC
jgi:hypothetical protein